ncbi:transposase family protein, partial [Aquimarina algiphila]
MNLIEHTKDDKSKGFLFVIAVKDVHSGDILGYSFDYSENRWSVTNALKMAVENTGYLPYEIVADRFPGHNTKEVKALTHNLSLMGVKMTVTHKATGKPHVERGFGTIQSVFMQESKYYYGEGIQSRRASAHRSPEYLKEIRKESRKEGFGLTEAYNESQHIIEAFR